MSDSESHSGVRGREKKLKRFTGNDKKLFKNFKDDFLNDLSEKDPSIKAKLLEQIENGDNAGATAVQKKILNKFRAKLYRKTTGPARKTSKEHNTTCWELFSHLEESYGTLETADRLGELVRLNRLQYDGTKDGPAKFIDKVSETVEDLESLNNDELKLLILAEKLPQEFKSEVNKEVLRLDEEGEELDYAKLRGRLVNAHKLDSLREESDVAVNNVMSRSQIEAEIWEQAEAHYNHSGNGGYQRQWKQKGKGSWNSGSWNKWTRPEKGKSGKGGKSKGKKGFVSKMVRKNQHKTPAQKAAEGQRCFVCGSDKHQINQCPKNTQKYQKKKGGK
jgi:hypothetical protein